MESKRIPSEDMNLSNIIQENNAIGSWTRPLSSRVYLREDGSIVTANAGPHELTKREAESFLAGGSLAVTDLHGDYCGGKASNAVAVKKLVGVVYLFKDYDPASDS